MRYLMLRVAVVAALSTLAIAQVPQQHSTPTTGVPPVQEVPSVNADLGPCWADFRVRNAAGTPLYNAKVHVLIRHGFMSKRKTDLEVGTNSDGKARVAGLPQQVKKPLIFEIRFERKQKRLEHDPGANCHVDFLVELK